MTDTDGDRTEQELQSMIAEARFDAILAGLPFGDETIEAGGITLAFMKPVDDEDSEHAGK
jgi:hypothetical protein